MHELALFAGAGGGILGGKILGWRTVCAVELDKYARSILLARLDDGTLDPFPVWDDVTTFDGRPWRGVVDVVSGGFPCQDISAAGKGAGIEGEKSGLWKQFARIIREVGPRFVFVENSPVLTSRGLGVVLGDLASMGYHAAWCVLGACHAGAPHKRERIWIVAYTTDNGTGWREQQPQGSEGQGHVADADGSLRQRRTDLAQREQKGGTAAGWGSQTLVNPDLPGCGIVEEGDAGQGVDGEGERDHPAAAGAGWWESEPHVDGMADGLAAPLDIHGAAAAGDVGRVATRIPNRNARLRCIGNGQVPACAALAWLTLTSLL